MGNGEIGNVVEPTGPSFLKADFSRYDFRSEMNVGGQCILSYVEERKERSDKTSLGCTQNRHKHKIL
jgi:hypothetical protein